MRVRYMPQRIDHEIGYTFAGERIIATVDSASDTFDFSDLPDGETVSIASTLHPCPVLAAQKVGGELYVTLLRPIPARPHSADYETPEDYEAALDAWRRLWTDDLEVAIGG